MQKDNRISSALPFSRGIAWLVQSMALLRMQAGRLILIAVFMQVILGLTQVPIIGLLIILSVPALSAGVLEAFDVTRRGGDYQNDQPGRGCRFRANQRGRNPVACESSQAVGA